MLIGCESTRPGVYFKRPEIKTCIVLEEDNLMACNGVIKEIPVGLIIPESSEDYLKAEEYFSERELGHYICLRHPKRCEKHP